ncbi:MAG TPA: hypothetical protein ENN51_06050 [candidate division WOR-3 bacterium]|uniref:FlgD Ig-like domain-containing protein n=1 Tax=candidate division WOR-3 bacterium TaxID=2052148 RepID=A0A7V0T6G3_UNCW3|nr:hypothetical protein [candidate division WOR-3 bacterium]
MDWNSDGIPDLISGDRSGFFNVFIRDSLGEMTAHKQYQLLDGTVWTVGANSQPAVVDWDNDGMKDVVLGREAYEIRIYLNQTSDTWPVFQDYEPVQAGGAPINLYRVNPYIFDLDGDGLWDLVAGENGGYIHFFRNTGTPGAPEFAAGETLKLEDGTPIRYTFGNAAGSRVGFGDWNNDGVTDFLLGTYEGHVALYLGVEQVGVEEAPPPVPDRFEVGPVPGRPVRFRWALGRPGRLEVFDALGRAVWNRTVAGEGVIVWDGTDESGRRLAAGAYFARLTGGEESRTARLVLAR